MGNAFPALMGFAALLLYIIVAIVLCRLAAKFRLFYRQNYLPGMCFLLFTSMPGVGDRISSSLLMSLLIIPVLWQLFNLYNQGKALKSIFYVSALIGLMALVFYPAALFIILVFVSLYLFRPFKLQEWIMALVGILAPIYFLASFLFLTNNLQVLQIEKVILKLPSLSQLGYEYYGYLLIGFSILAGMYFLQQFFLRQSIHARKCWVLIYWLLAICTLGATINYQQFPINWILIAVPVSMFMALAFFNFKNKWVGLILHWLIVIFALVGSYHILEKLNLKF